MDNRDEVKAFLTSRRAKITPRRAGLPEHHRNRRVPGLRRSEVAGLAGVSVEYYAQLERGDLAGVSDSVLDALAGALRLDDAERAHLTDLARAAGPSARARHEPPVSQVQPRLRRALELMTEVPTFVTNNRHDVLAANPLARALYAPMFAGGDRPANIARFIFLDPRARRFWRDWEHIADDSAAVLRVAAGRDPFDRHLTGLVEELCARSDEFRLRWATHDVRLHCSSVKRFHHPVVGDLSLNFESMEISAIPGQIFTVLTAEAGSPSDDALRLLADRAAAGRASGSGAPAGT